MLNKSKQFKGNICNRKLVQLFQSLHNNHFLSRENPFIKLGNHDLSKVKTLANVQCPDYWSDQRLARRTKGVGASIMEN